MDVSQAVLNGVSGVLGSLITIGLTPRLQHHFWKRQREADLRLEAYRNVNRLVSEFLQEFIANGAKTKPSLDWFTRFREATVSVKVLFSDEAHTCFKELEKRVDPNLGSVGHPDFSGFVTAQEKALEAMFREI